MAPWSSLGTRLAMDWQLAIPRAALCLLNYVYSYALNKSKSLTGVIGTCRWPPHVTYICGSSSPEDAPGPKVRSYLEIPIRWRQTVTRTKRRAREWKWKTIFRWLAPWKSYTRELSDQRLHGLVYKKNHGACLRSLDWALQRRGTTKKSVQWEGINVLGSFSFLRCNLTIFLSYICKSLVCNKLFGGLSLALVRANSRTILSCSL